MTLPLLMDLANYRVSGAAPRLLRTKAEWDEEDGEIGGVENIQRQESALTPYIQ